MSLNIRPATMKYTLSFILLYAACFSFGLGNTYGHNPSRLQTRATGLKSTQKAEPADQNGDTAKQSLTESSKSRLSGLFKMLKLNKSKNQLSSSLSGPIPEIEPPPYKTTELAKQGPSTSRQDLRLSRSSENLRSRTRPAEHRNPGHNRVKSADKNSRREYDQAEAMAGLDGPGYIRTIKSTERELIRVPSGQFKEVTIRDPKRAAVQAEMLEDTRFPSHTRKVGVTALGHKAMNRAHRGFGADISHFYSRGANLQRGDSFGDDEQEHTWKYNSRLDPELTGASSVSKSGMATLEAEANTRDREASSSFSRGRHSTGRKSYQY